MPRFAVLLLCLGALAGTCRAAITDLAVSSNALGLHLYDEMASQTDPDDLALSPYSVEMAMSLLECGATGETRAELNRVLGLPSNELELAFALHSVRDELGFATVGFDWSEANGLYVQEGWQFTAPFLKTARDTFSARLQTVDFTDPSSAETTINDWIGRATGGHIQTLAHDLQPETRALLANAVYFKAPWAKAFELNDTIPSLFHSTLHGDEPVPTMYLKARLAYRKADGYQVIALPYRGGSFQMLILLPDERNGAGALARSLTASALTDLKALSTSETISVNLELPRFMVAPKPLDLSGAMKALGIHRVFEPGRAELDALAPAAQGKGSLSVSKVLHQAYVNANEEGTEASAATTVALATLGIEVQPPHQIDFNVDHPFLFAIQDCKTGVCLFFGSVANPESK